MGNIAFTVYSDYFFKRKNDEAIELVSVLLSVAAGLYNGRVNSSQVQVAS